MISACHSGNIGDIIYSIPCIISLCDQKKTKCDLYLKINKRANYSGKHPLGNLLLNEDYANKIKPLIESQEWCNSVKIWDNDEIEYDLDLFRLAMVGAHGSLPRWYFYVYTSTYDLSQPWLIVKPSLEATGRVLVNRSWRYRISKIDFSYLNRYPVSFIGVDDEYEDFKLQVPKAEHIKVNDFLHLAEIIAGASLFIGNQSFCYSLAEAIKVKPRILEVCQSAMNVIPTGANAHDFINHFGLSSLLENLLPH